MKKILLFMLSILLVLYSFSSCGLTVTEIENESTAENTTLTIEESTTVSQEKTEIQSESVSQENLTDLLSDTEKNTVETTHKTEAPTKGETQEPTVPATQNTEVPTKGEAQKPSVPATQNTEVPTKGEAQKPSVPATQNTEVPTKTESQPTTVAVPHSTTTEPTTQIKKKACTIEISCKTILDNFGDLDVKKKPFVPSDGVILTRTAVEFEEGENVFNVLKKVCQDKGIQFEYRFTPAYNSNYIEGIHQIYEFDCGDNSGWMYSVNGIFPNKGCNMYTVSEGDSIKFLYTCDLGYDLGAGALS